MCTGHALVETVLATALYDEAFKSDLLDKPSAVLKKMGMYIPDGKEKDFDRFFKQQTEYLFKPKKSLLTSKKIKKTKPKKFTCTACKIAAWTVAIAIVTVGAAHIGALTVSSYVVIQLAAFATLSTAQALLCIQSLVNLATFTAPIIAQEICIWMNVCP